MTEEKRKRRSNAEILEDLKKERQDREAASKARSSKTKTPGAKRVRRTKAQIEADKRAELAARELLAQERASHIPAPKVPKFTRTVRFVEDGITALGNVWEKGDVIVIAEGSEEYAMSFRADGTFIFSLTPDEQRAKWGHVKYSVDELSNNVAEAPQIDSEPFTQPVGISFGSQGTKPVIPAPTAVYDDEGFRKNPTFGTVDISIPDEELAHLYDDSDLPEDAEV